MSIRDGFNMYYKHFGIRGLLAISAYRLIGRPREIIVRPPGIQHPVCLRVRTTDVSIYSSILLGREYDFDLPFSPKIIVDAGANVGMASIYFSHRYPDAKIIAVEAEASNFAMLARNVKLYPSIIPVHAALWNRDGEISIADPGPFEEWGFITREGPGVKVRAITMQTLMNEMQIRLIDLLKVDIEGAEKEVFETCDWMQDVRCLMIELHDRFKPGCSEVVSSATQEFSKFRRGETNLYLRDATNLHAATS
jgi:FkbM family methyltransferase